MEKEYSISKGQYYKDLWQIALPISLQCLLQSSFSVVDQIMIGQLGSTSIAAIGLCGKFISILTVMLQAIAAVAGIIMAQAVGKGNKREISKGLYTNLILAVVFSGTFVIPGILIPSDIMSIYSEDISTVETASVYLEIYSLSFIPMALNSIFSAFLRCYKETKVPLYAGICSAVLNTVLNYGLIYGRLLLPQLGVAGAAWASVVAQFMGCLVVTFAFIRHICEKNKLHFEIYRGTVEWFSYFRILLPLFVCEFLWVLGENIYGYIYGHIGTQACAAMTLINPIVSLMIGALSGAAQAAGIMVGQLLGKNDKEMAYITGKRLMKTGLIGSVTLSTLLLIVSPLYIQIFNVEPEVRQMTHGILMAFAVICPIKVMNMIMGGGIIRSGGKTQYVMCIDMIGTWVFGVPLGLLTAFVLGLPIALVYFILSLEELVRLVISIIIFRKKSWMQQL